MSGPKSSNVELREVERRRLEAERQRRLEDERRRIEEERRRQEEMRCQGLEQHISSVHKTLQEMKGTIGNETKTVLDEAKRLYGSSHDLDNAERLRDAMLQKVDMFPKSYGVRESGNMAYYLQRVSAFNSEMTVQTNGRLREDLEKVRTEIKQHKIAMGEKELFNTTFETKKRTVISLEAKRKGIQTQNSDANVDQELSAFYSVVNPYIQSRFLANKGEIEELVQSVEEIMRSKTLDVHYKSAQIVMRKKSFLTTKSKYDKEMEQYTRMSGDFEQSFATYLALCGMAGEEAKPYSFEPAKVFQTLMELTQETGRLEAQLQKKVQTEYIAQSIDEVMAELGYEIVATDFMTTPQRSTVHHIYEFEQGNVINVYASDNGSLMFEVSGVQGSDSPMTDLEKLKVKESMESFCTKYPVIRDRLKERGIQMNHEDLKPPDVRYARAIDLRRKKVVATKKKEAARTRPQVKKKEMRNR